MNMMKEEKKKKGTEKFVGRNAQFRIVVSKEANCAMEAAGSFKIEFDPKTKAIK